MTSSASTWTRSEALSEDARSVLKTSFGYGGAVGESTADPGYASVTKFFQRRM